MSTFATWNPADTSPDNTLSGGNLTLTTAPSFNGSSTRGTVGVSAAKWYWEQRITTALGIAVGVANASASLVKFPGNDANGWTYTSAGFANNNASSSAYGASYSDGDVVGVALNLAAGTLEFYKNGVSQGVAFSGLSGPLLPFGGGGSTGVIVANFGATAFSYSVPAGFNSGIYTSSGAGDFSMLAYWMGGAGSKAGTSAKGYRSMQAYWMGGAASSSPTPPGAYQRDRQFLHNTGRMMNI